jgi:hypothetical protein
LPKDWTKCYEGVLVGIVLNTQLRPEVRSRGWASEVSSTQYSLSDEAPIPGELAKSLNESNNEAALSPTPSV